MKAVPDVTTIRVHVPIQFSVRGGRKTVVSDCVPPLMQPRTDNSLIKALARAFRWRLNSRAANIHQ